MVQSPPSLRRGASAIPEIGADLAAAPSPTAQAVRITAMLNGVAVVVAALYFGQELLVPLMLAGLLAFVLAPLARWLNRLLLPRLLAVLLTVVFAFLVIGQLGLIVAGQISMLADQVPRYQANVIAKWNALLAGNALLAEAAKPLTSGVGANGGTMFSLAERFARPLLGPVTTAAVVLTFTLVILLYSEDLRDRFVRLVGRRDLHRTISAMNDAGHRLSRYFLSQLTINAAFGLWIALGLWLLGVPGIVLFGLVATLMRFVPYVGSFISVVPPMALAIAIAPGWSLAILVVVLFVGSDLLVGQVIEPLLYGHSTGISPVAVLVATSFWTLLWGFVGLLIATPLTVCLVVLGRNVAAFAFLDVLFGSDSPLLPSETFYQRALEGRSLALRRAALGRIGEGSRADYYDHVALPGLVLAQRNRGDVDLEDGEDPVHVQVSALLQALAPPGGPSPARERAGAWAIAGTILCLPARGDMDDLGAEMAAQVLHEAGFGALTAPNTVLDAPLAETTGPARLCCLSVIEEGASVTAIRFFVRRIHRRMPGVDVVVGLWGADANSPMLSALREEGGEAHVILSLSELVAYVKAVAEPS